MKVKIRKSNEHGRTKLDWLDGKHGFSFGRYHNPDNMNFGKLIVFNDDHIAPGKGFGAHPHENAEVVTIVLKGSLKHEDSEGNKGIINPGEVQRMSAGTGIWHSEFNASTTKELHLLQIWLEPAEINTAPSYEQKPFLLIKNKLNKIVSNTDSSAVHINQNAEFFFADLAKNTDISQKISNNRSVYLYTIKGSISFDNHILSEGDSAEITDAKSLSIISKEESSILLIELEK